MGITLVPVWFLGRQLAGAALVSNALRPNGRWWRGFPSFVAGWLTTELAPQLLTLTVADTVAHLPRRGRRRTRLALAVALANAAGLAYLANGGRTAESRIGPLLDEGIGTDPVDVPQIVEAPLWRTLVNPLATVPDEVEVIRDLPYTDAGRRGLLDVYRHRDGTRTDAPVLLQVHGGAWRVGDKSQQGLPLMARMAARGWVCVAINYRLAPRDPFPAQIIDVKRAIAWIREHIAEYGGDPGYVAITGGSAGGHLAALAAVTPGDPAYQPGFEDVDTTIQVAAPQYAVYDLAGATGLRSAIGMRDHFLAPHVFLRDYAEDPDAFEAASPIVRVGPDAPDMLLMHGSNDSLVDVRQARRFAAKVREVSGSNVTYVELPGAQHAYDVFHSLRAGAVVRAVDRYLHWHWSRYRDAR